MNYTASNHITMFHRSSFKDGPIGRAIISLLLIASAVVCTLSIITVELLYIWQTFGLNYFLSVQLFIFLVSAAVMVISLKGRSRDESIRNKLKNTKKSQKLIHVGEDSGEMANMQIQHGYTSQHEKERNMGTNKRKKSNSNNDKESIRFETVDSTKSNQRTRKQKKRDRKQKNVKQKNQCENTSVLLQDVTNNVKKQNEGTNSHVNGSVARIVKPVNSPLAVDGLASKGCSKNSTSNSSSSKPARCSTKNKENLHKLCLMNRFTKKLSEEWLELNSSCTSNSTTINPSTFNSPGINTLDINSPSFTSPKPNTVSTMDSYNDFVSSYPKKTAPAFIERLESSTSFDYRNTTEITAYQNMSTSNMFSNTTTSIQNTTCKSKPYFGQMNDFNDEKENTTDYLDTRKNENAIFESSSFFSSQLPMSEIKETSDYQTSHVPEYSLFGSSQFNSNLVWSPLGL